MRSSVFKSPTITLNCVHAGFQKLLGRSRISVEHPQYQGVKLSAGRGPGQGLWCAISGVGYEAELSWLLEESQADSVLVDVGANIGIYSVFFAAKNRGSGRVYSLEPSPQAFELLSFNIEQNGLTGQVTPVAVGMAARSGYCQMEGDESKWSQLRITSIVSEGRGQSGQGIRVTSLSDFVEAQGLTRLDFLKLDAEGQEGFILQSSLEVIRRFQPKLIVEVTCPEATKLVMESLEAMNYRSFKLAEDSPNCVAVPRT